MKNRYCRNTKLSETEFMWIVVHYCVGSLATDTQVALAGREMRLSRQTIEKKFLDIGHYLYRNNALPQLLRFHKELNPDSDRTDDEWEQLWLDGLWENMRGTLDYAEYRFKNRNYPGHDTLIRTLRMRWKLYKGFPRNKFPSHVGFATFYDWTRRTTTLEVGISNVIRGFEKNPL